jgi:nicotinamide-nucleotide amidase
MTNVETVESIARADLEAQAVLIATRLGRELERRGWLVCSAESCTGGAIARALTETGGSSAWFDSAYITYSNRAKMANLGVLATTLESHGAVSEPVVAAMAGGALERSQCQLAIAVSGVAGPGGGSPDKPVGTVCFGWALRAPTHSSHSDGQVAMAQSVHTQTVCTQTLRLPGDRYEVRLRTVCFALLRAEALVAEIGHSG